MTYVTLGQPGRRQKRRRTLGDSMSYGQAVSTLYNPSTGVLAPSWADLTDPANYVFNAGENLYQLIWPASPSTPLDVAANIATGGPTSGQLDTNAQQYTQAAARMARVLQSQGVPLPAVLDPSTAAAQADADQVAYANSIGGTAQQQLSPGLPSINSWAWVILAAVAALIFATR